jgi:hypothetical protein
MSCRQAWDQTFVVLNLNRSWFTNDYVTHRHEILFQTEQSKVQETMEHVDKYNKVKDFQTMKEENWKEIKKIQSEITKLNSLIDKHNVDNRVIDRKIRFIKFGKDDSIERQKFTMPCQKDECKGFMSSAYKCGVCQDFCCSKCLQVLGPDKNVEHKCDENLIKNAEFIKNTTKPCPKCGQRIHKVSGCDQMWCTECHTSFSWKTGQITGGVIHNPHYFQYMRTNNNGNIPRQPGDNPCADTASYLTIIIKCIQKKLYHNKLLCIYSDPQQINNNNNNNNNQPHFNNHNQYISSSIYSKIPSDITTENNDLRTWDKNEHLQFHNDAEALLSTLRIFRHIQYVEMIQTQLSIDRCNNTVDERVKYITNELDKSNFIITIAEKDRNRKKYMDLMYIYDLITNVGFETVNKIFDVVDKNMHLSGNEIAQLINNKSISEIEDTFSAVSNSLKQFISYCNQQFDIISVSHNVTAKHIYYGTHHNLGIRRTFISLKHLEDVTIKDTQIKNELQKLTGYIDLAVCYFGSQKKSTMKIIKEYYSKT